MAAGQLYEGQTGKRWELLGRREISRERENIMRILNLHTRVDALTKSHVYGGRPIPTVSNSADKTKKKED